MFGSDLPRDQFLILSFLRKKKKQQPQPPPPPQQQQPQGDPRSYVCQAPGALIRVSTCGSILGPLGSILVMHLQGSGFQSVFGQESVFRQEYKFSLLKNVRAKRALSDSLDAFGDTRTSAFGALHTYKRGSWQPQPQQHEYNLGRLRFNRREASTPILGVEACSFPSRRSNPIPAIPPCVVRTPHLHGAPTTEETFKL